MQYTDERLTITHDSRLIGPRSLSRVITAEGYAPEYIPNDKQGNKLEENSVLWGWKWRFWVSAAFAIPVVMVAYVLPSFESSKTAVSRLAAPGIAFILLFLPFSS